MKLHQILMNCAITLSLLSGGALAADDKAAKQTEIRAVTQASLEKFYAAQPELKAQVAKAPGYGVVRIYVHDGDENVDFCETYILMQDAAGNACVDVARSPNAGLQAELKVSGSKTKTTGQDKTVELREHAAANGIVLLQNRPNPFKEETIIAWTLPAKSRVDIRIQDVTGRISKTYGGTYATGYHELRVTGIKYKGLLYYQLISGETVLTRKMISVE